MLSIFRSRTVWTIIVAAVFNTLQATLQIPGIDPRWVGTINAALTLLGMYFRFNPQAVFTKPKV